jgi:hypothetical protein
MTEPFYSSFSVRMIKRGEWREAQAAMLMLFRMVGESQKIFTLFELKFKF